MYVPIAGIHVRGEAERLAHSALPQAPVRPMGRERTEVGRVRRGAAATLRRSTGRLGARH